MVEGDVYPEKLMGSNEPAPRQLSIGPLKGQDAGAIVRAARITAGLTLADLGRRCGYSASQVSRYERGITPLTDITLLRRFSHVLAISPQVFGLTPPDGSRAGRHAVEPKDGDPRVAWPRVSREPQWEDGEDPVRLRQPGRRSPERSRPGSRERVPERREKPAGIPGRPGPSMRLLIWHPHRAKALRALGSAGRRGSRGGSGCTAGVLRSCSWS
jgi:transcriptional regulator with XRE-family HTH domain